MDPVVQIEGVGNVQFPASMSEQDIGKAAHRLYTQAGARSISANPPAAAKPPNPIQGELDHQASEKAQGWDPITPGNAATGFLKSLYQTSAPGIAASIAQKHAPQAAQGIPESLQGMPLEQVPAAAIATFFGGEEPTTQLAEHTVTAPGAMALPKIGKPGIASRMAEHLPVIGKGVRLYNLGREVFGREEAPPAPVPPAPAPQTNGIEWGTGGQGPLELRGKTIPPEAPQPPAPEAFTFPKIDPYRAGYRASRAYYGGVQPEPIPPRPGLMLPSGQPEPVELPVIGKPQNLAQAPRSIETVPKSTWPPAAPRYNPESKVELPKPKPFRDVQEDSMIQDAMRQDLSAHEQSASMTAAKEFAAGHSMSTPKSTLIERARDQMNPWSNQPKAPEMPAKPVAPSKPVAPEPAKKVAPPLEVPAPKPTKSAAPPAPPSEDLTGILRQSVKQVREKKAGKLPAVSGGSESLPKVESASESASFKRANPPQVAQPTVLKRNVPFESMTGNREIQNLQADEYILPGLEEYRIGIVKPRGSIAARNKLGFEAYELNSGRLIFHEPYQGSTLDRTLSGAMKVLQSQGKAKIDAAIGGAIRK